MLTLISATTLKATLADLRQKVALVDCRFNLADPAEGEQLFEASHLEDARYLHLDRDLSGPIRPGLTGRHPLPDQTAFLQTLDRHGITECDLIVAYDTSGGAFAARLWWLAQWAGLGHCAVLDGGMQAWSDDKSRVRTMTERPASPVDTVTADDIAGNTDSVLVDARDEVRFRGEVEPIDPVAGHIPGAVCVPFMQNLDADGYFLPTGQLRERFESVYAKASTVPVMYCGSGVTAAHNCLAAVHAGYAMPKLYAGSWSEWITDSARPVALGAG